MVFFDLTNSKNLHNENSLLGCFHFINIKLRAKKLFYMKFLDFL